MPNKANLESNRANRSQRGGAAAGSDKNAGPKRRFLGWQAPILALALEPLKAGFMRQDCWDMRGLIVVLPSSQACRRLSELLASEAEAGQLQLYPPKMITLGRLPEQLYFPRQAFASAAVQQLAWMRALRATSADELKHILPTPPASTQTQPWLEMGSGLTSIHEELASDRLDFRAVWKHLAADHPERPRWQVLADIQRRYLEQLSELQFSDMQTARLQALANHEPATRQKVVLIGCVDLNGVQRGFVQAVASQVEVWIAAPEKMADSFDDLGCVRSDVWTKTELNIPAERVFVGTGASSQADLAAACLADLGEQFHIRDVSLAVPDPSLIPELKRRLDLAGVQARYGAGERLVQSEPIVLLARIGKYLQNRSYQSFAALIRHPAVERLLQHSKLGIGEDWLAQLDKYYQEALPKRIDGFVNHQAAGAKVYRQVTKAIQHWLSDLTAKPAKLGTFAHPLIRVLATAYDQQRCDLTEPSDACLYQAAEQTCQALVDLREIPEDVQPILSVPEMIDWLIHHLAGRRVAEPPQLESLEMLGWLDLLMDDASAVVVTGVHDAVLPGSVNSHPFLPNALRQQLGMVDNDRRLARDLYAMRVLLESRKDVRLIVGKTDASGDPLLPSRLLTAGALQDLPARVLHLVCDDQIDVLPAVTNRWQASDGDSFAAKDIDQSSDRTTPSNAFGPQPPVLKVRPQQITVTAFRDYLQCPYRFYLRHILKLRSVEDGANELDASQFGNLVHDTLAELQGPIAESDDPQAVAEFLNDHLRTIANQRYGRYPSAAIMIQIEQAEQRLAEFAVHQAKHAAEGWRIEYVERGVDREDGVLLGSSPEPLCLVGRIDRIDFHPERGEWAIWDYKTSESAKNPVHAHWSKKDGWIDLQLPLYIRIAEKLGVRGVPSLGYITVPKQSADIGFQRADFTAQQIEDAMRTADEIVDRVLAGDFWPPRDESVVFDDFARICQTRSQSISSPPPTVKTQRATEARKIELDEATQDRSNQLLANATSVTPELPPVLIRASAGTGKTFQLTNRLLQIILSGQSIDHVLATTFTRKAAGEILRRVLERLATACLSDAGRRDLEPHLPSVDLSAANCLAALRRLTASIHRFRVCTLDSFFAQVARAFSFEMSLPQSWSPLEPSQESAFQLNAIGQVLEQQDRKTLLGLVRMLSKGETSRRIADEMSRTVQAGYPVYRWTREADWKQLDVPAAPSEQALESALQTLEATKFGHKALDPQLEKLHLAARSGNWEAVIEHGIFARLEDEVPSYYRKELPKDLVLSLQLLRERAAAELLTIRSKQTLASYQVLQAYDQAYSQQIKQTRLLAFADVTHYLSRWLNEGQGEAKKASGETGRSQELVSQRQLEFRLDCGVRHLLLDEFQDTAPQQWNILEPLARPLSELNDGRHSVFVVGDTKQAIYAWRGGVSEVFDAVAEALPSVKQEELKKSFRSTQEVLQAVNDTFMNLTQHDNFGDSGSVARVWAESFPEHSSMLADNPQESVGYVRLQNGPKLDSALSSQQRRQAFLDFSARQIAELTSRASASVGVLLRTNTHVAEMIALLQEHGVSASQDGGNPLTDSIAVELLLSALHLADHPGDSICAYHLANSPVAKVVDDETFSPQRFSSWLRGQVMRQGLGRTLEGLADCIAAHVSWWERHRMEQLIRMAHQFDAAGGGRLSEFERQVEIQRVALPSEAQVQVMTIHKSKGLEFDAVFLPDLQIDLVDGNSLLVLRGEDPCQPPTGVLRYMNASLQSCLPDSWQAAFGQHRQRQVSESLCLLYVAMTRARNALYMTPRPTSRTASQELGSILQSTLGDAELIGKPESVLYERGNEDWYRAFPLSGNRGQKAQKPVSLSIRLDRNPDRAGEKGLRVAAPSSVHKTQELLRIGSAFSVSHSSGAIYGKLMHAFLQQVTWLEDFEFDRGALQRVAAATIEPEALSKISIARAIDDFEKILELESVRATLSKARYQQARFGRKPERVEIDNEREVSTIIGDELITGSIDRLAVLYHGDRAYAAEIFDYKTDAYDPSMTLLWLDDRIEYHRPQLEAYARVVSRMFHLAETHVETNLLMLSTDDLVKLTETVPPPHFSTQMPSLAKT